MSRTQRSIPKSDGFTIIEIMIVLSIGGLIILLVFMAIPALARSSRNNQRRQDVARIAEAYTHYELNNSGNLPVDPSFLTGQNVKLSYYQISPTNIVIVTQALGSIITPSAVTSTDIVKIYNYEKCGMSNGTATQSGAGYSDVVALYAIETGGNPSSICEPL